MLTIRDKCALFYNTNISLQHMLKATELKVTVTDDIYVTQLVKELAKHMSGPALDYVSPQLQHYSPQT